MSVSIDVSAIEAIIRKVKEEKRPFLLPDESQGVMKAIGHADPAADDCPEP